MTQRLRIADGGTDRAGKYVDQRGTSEGAAHVAEEYPDFEQTHLLLFGSFPTTTDPALTTSYSDELEVDGAQSVTLFLKLTAVDDGSMTFILQGSMDGATFFDVEVPLTIMAPLADKGAATAYYMVQRTFCAKCIRLKLTTVHTCTLDSGSGIYWRP